MESVYPELSETRFIAVAVKYDSLTAMNTANDRDFLLMVFKKLPTSSIPEIVPLAYRFPELLGTDGFPQVVRF